MGNQTAANVRVEKPVGPAGAIQIAPIGTPLPTDWSTALNGAFNGVGYLLKGGVTNANGRTNNEIEAFGGDIVAVASSADNNKYSFTAIETNDVTMGMYRGAANVSTTGNTRTIKYNAKDLDHVSVVLDFVSGAGLRRRIVIPDAQVTERGDIVTTDDNATAFPMTMTGYPDSSGNKSYEYQQIAAAVPSITSVTDFDGTPTTLPVAGGGIAQVVGQGFTGATALSVAGNTVATSAFTVVSDTKIIFVPPAHASGTNLPVIVTNATGPSINGTTAAAYA